MIDILNEQHFKTTACSLIRYCSCNCQLFIYLTEAIPEKKDCRYAFTSETCTCYFVNVHSRFRCLVSL